eukprot:Clim_evm16s195 gene=Clim_evmTU16s195
MSGLSASCLFCKIIRGEIPSAKLIDTPKVFAFLDINPLSKGHALVIPKFCGEKLTDIPDEYLAECMPAASKIAKVLGAENYNILQNNGRLAHQEVMHVHFHIIPKPNGEEGLGIGWPAKSVDPPSLGPVADELKKKIAAL